METNDYTGAIPLPPDKVQAVRRAAKNGEYHLLMGAGASRDSRSGNGAALPGSVGLIKMLQERYDVPVEEGDQLWRIYDRAVSKSSPQDVYRWLRAEFWGAEHPQWMERLARSPWAAVWTLNIDDSFESAYNAVRSEGSRGLRSLNWDDEYRIGRELNVIHLHGMVDRDEPRDLVFSLTEYSAMAQARASWPANFRDSYGNSPYVILGARLIDEPDIEAVISKRRPSHSAPTFYVSRTISAGMEQDLKGWGITPVQSAADEFAAEWGALSGIDLGGELGDDFEIGLRIGQQFRELKSDRTPRATKGHDLLGGDEPTWGDVLNGIPAELEWVSNAKWDCSAVGNTLPGSTVVAYAGRRLTGRSTGLLQIGLHLRKNAWRTYQFRHEGRLDQEAILAFASDEKSIALLFDGAADVAEDINRLVSEARMAGLNILCVCVENSEKEAALLGRISQAHIARGRVGSIERRLTRIDAPRLVDKLTSAGRLGVLETKEDRFRIRHFEGKELFDSMARLEDAPGFGKRVESLVAPVDDRFKLEAILLAAFAAQVDRRLLAVDLSRMLSVESDELIRAIQDDSQLQDFLKTDGVSVTTRQRWMARQPVINKLGEEASIQAVARGIRALSPRVGRASLRERNPTAMLVGAFMSQKALRELAPSVNLDEWYGSLIDIFGDWNGRYWEQRAILARRDSTSDRSLLAKAESFAQRATSLTSDSYSYTTLGTVLMDRAAYDSVELSKYYERGYTAFETASRLERTGRDIVTWMAYLRCALNVLDRILRESLEAGRPVLTMDVWEKVCDDWQTVQNQLKIVADSGDETRRDFNVLGQRYEQLRKAAVDEGAP